MKPVTVAISVAVLALPLYAEDQQKPNTTTTTLSAPAAAQAQDSPLVRAAKASARQTKKKSAIMITNDNLARTGADFTTTTLNTPLPAAYPQPNNDAAKLEAAARQRREADEKAKKEAAAKRQQDVRRATADYYGESIEPKVDDPAMQEHQMDKLTSQQPAKPPQE